MSIDHLKFYQFIYSLKGPGLIIVSLFIFCDNTDIVFDHLMI